MIAELFFSIIFIIGIGGVLIILARKIPVLNSLPQNGSTGIKRYKIISEAENKIKDFLIIFKKQIYLHKFLSWVKVMALKIETIVDKRLHKIRKKAQQMDKDLNEKK